jgi:HEAT repeat protein
MENKSKKTKKQKVKYSTVFATFALITYVLFCLGCEQQMRPRFELPPSVSPESLVPEATRIVREGLADPDPLIRNNAIEVVATTRRIRLMPKVQRLLKDEFVPVRFAAVLAVGDMEYSLAKEDITAMLQDQNLNVRIATLYALGRLGSAESVDQLRKAIASNDQSVRANVALLLGKIGDNNELTRQVLWWTLRRQDSGDMVRFQTAEAIAMLGDDRIYPKLWTMLISAYADDRVMGIKAMAALGTPQARDSLLTMLDDGVVEVRLAAAEKLGMLNDESGAPIVLDVFNRNLGAGLDKESLERLNVRTVLAIGRIGTPSLTGFLPGFLKNESKIVRLAAAMAVFQCTM